MKDLVMRLLTTEPQNHRNDLLRYLTPQVAIGTKTCKPKRVKNIFAIKVFDINCFRNVYDSESQLRKVSDDQQFFNMTLVEAGYNYL